MSKQEDQNEEYDLEAAKLSHSFFSENIKMSGNLNIRGDVRIDGAYHGKVESSGSMFLGRKASLEGEIRCDALVSGGSVKGDIYATKELNLQDYSSVEGKVETLSMSIGKDVAFNATCKISEAQTTPKKVVPLVRKFRKAISHR